MKSSPKVKDVWLLAVITQPAEGLRPGRTTRLLRRDLKLGDAAQFLLEAGYVPSTLDKTIAGPLTAQFWIVKDRCCDTPSGPPLRTVYARPMKLGETMDRVKAFSKSAWISRARMQKRHSSFVFGATAAQAKENRARDEARSSARSRRG